MAEAEPRADTPITAKVRPLLTLLPFLSRYRPLMAGWLGFLLLSSAASLVLPYAVREMIVAKTAERAKVIASGKLDKAVKVVGLKVTPGARKIIEAAGGSIE